MAPDFTMLSKRSQPRHNTSQLRISGVDVVRWNTHPGSTMSPSTHGSRGGEVALAQSGCRTFSDPLTMARRLTLTTSTGTSTSGARPASRLTDSVGDGERVAPNLPPSFAFRFSPLFPSRGRGGGGSRRRPSGRSRYTRNEIESR